MNKLIFILLFLVFSPAFHATGQDNAAGKEALYYLKTAEPKNSVTCQLCPRMCLIQEGKSGFCRARKNIKGRLYSLGYNQPCSIHVDPMEKKPFFHVLPGGAAFSIACAGCNFRCQFCQNWEISQSSPLETANYFFTPEKIVAMAAKNRCAGIAYTYSEPTNFYEYMLDIARLARQKKILNIYHSNGFINPQPLKQLCKYLDAANIDLKGFSDRFYAQLCEGELEPVLATLKTLKQEGVWLEITNLIIPGYNDNPEEIKRMCEWIKTNLGPDVPLHFSRFFPSYRMTNMAPTPVQTMEKAREIAKKAGLNYVYLGNLPGNPAENTYCPGCGRAVIERSGYSIMENNIKDGKCKFCGKRIPGIWTR